jgi:uncharacterized protein (DUF488 family)
MKYTIYTFGHSTRTIDEFIDILEEYQIEVLMDIRTYPASRYNPQYKKDNLKKSLKAHKIKYEYLALLGGFRKTKSDSVNSAWENKSFRGFADYMQSKEFESGINELIKIAKKYTTAIMCSEAVPWRCHRSLVSDAMIVRGWKVVDIISMTKSQVHKLTLFASVNGTEITYPPVQGDSEHSSSDSED